MAQLISLLTSSPSILQPSSKLPTYQKTALTTIAEWVSSSSISRLLNNPRLNISLKSQQKSLLTNQNLRILSMCNRLKNKLHLRTTAQLSLQLNQLGIVVLQDQITFVNAL